MREIFWNSRLEFFGCSRLPFKGKRGWFWEASLSTYTLTFLLSFFPVTVANLTTIGEREEDNERKNEKVKTVTSQKNTLLNLWNKMTNFHNLPAFVNISRGSLEGELGLTSGSASAFDESNVWVPLFRKVSSDIFSSCIFDESLPGCKSIWSTVKSLDLKSLISSPEDP